MRSRTLLLAGIALVSCVSFILGDKSLAEEKKATGTQRMAALLQQLAAESDADPQANPFGNKKRADALRLLLAKEVDHDKRVDIQLAFADELLRAGQTNEAIQQLSALDEQLSKKSGEQASRIRSNV